MGAKHIRRVRHAALLLLVACSSVPPPPELVVALKSAPTAESARMVMVHRCGTCHRADLPDHKPLAVAKFDLGDLTWTPAYLSDAQLRTAVERMGGSGDEQDHFRRYVEEELKRR